MEAALPTVKQLRRSNIRVKTGRSKNLRRVTPIEQLVDPIERYLPPQDVVDSVEQDAGNGERDQGTRVDEDQTNGVQFTKTNNTSRFHRLNNPWIPPSHHDGIQRATVTAPSPRLPLIVAQQYSASFGNKVHPGLGTQVQARVWPQPDARMSSNLDITESLLVSARNTPAETGKLVVDLTESSDDAMYLEDDEIPKMIKVRLLPTYGNRDSTSLKSSSASVPHMPLSNTYYENDISRKEDEFGMCRKELEDAHDEIMVKDRRIRELEHALHEAEGRVDTATYSAEQRRYRLQKDVGGNVRGDGREGKRIAVLMRED